MLNRTCLVPRRLSFDENVRAKEGGKETAGETSLRLPSVPFLWSLAVHYQSLALRARLCHAKNEAPEEEAVEGLFLYFCCRQEGQRRQQICSVPPRGTGQYQNGRLDQRILNFER